MCVDGYQQSDRVHLACVHARLHFGLGQPKTPPVIVVRLVLALCRGPAALEVALRAEARVRMARVQQPVHVFLIGGQTLGLVVRPTAAIAIGALVVRDAGPRESAANLLDGTWDVARLVCVLDAQKELAIGALSCQKVVEEGSSQTAKMQEARRAGCETDAHRHSNKSKNEIKKFHWPWIFFFKS